jgi:aminomethyltransferase
MAGLADEIRAIRETVALSEGAPPLVPLRITGGGAFEALDRVCPAELFLQDAQMRLTLLLDEAARPFADVYVARDDEAFYLLAEGPSAADLVAHLNSHFPGGADVAIQDLSQTHDVVSLHGPYAWELLAECLDPEAMGLPYLTFFHAGAITCFRGGKTGEYGYDLLVPKEETDRLKARIEEAGREFEFELGAASLEALELCALENWFFNIRREGKPGLTPIELQLQWRVSYRKGPYVGAAALAERRRTGPARRVTCVVGPGPMADGDEVLFEGAPIGAILHAGFSPLRGDWVAAALLDSPFAHAGVDRYELAHGGARSPLRTATPPVINNRSLYVSPQRHSFQTRLEHAFPPIVG